MAKKQVLIVSAAIAVSFAGFVGAIILLMTRRIVTYEMAMLMLAALVGLYVGFGVLIAVYRLMRKLE